MSDFYRHNDSAIDHGSSTKGAHVVPWMILVVLGCLSSAGCEDEMEIAARPHYPLIGEYLQADWGPNGILAVERVLKSDDPDGPSHDPSTWGLYTLREDGTDSKPLAMGRLIDLAWSPDGEWIAFVNGRGLQVIRADGQDMERLDTGILSPQGVSWSPDGRWILFSVTSGVGTNRGLWLIRPDGTGLRQLRKPPLEQMCAGCTASTDSLRWLVSLPDWSLDGHRITYIDNTNFRIAIYDTVAVRVDFIYNSPRGLYRPQFSPDGSTIVFHTRADAGGKLQIGLIDVDGRNLRWLPVSGENPTWSSNGRQIIYRKYDYGAFRIVGGMAENPGNGWGDLWVIDADGRNHRQLTFANGVWGGP